MRVRACLASLFGSFRLLLFIASVGSEVIDQIDAEKYPSQKAFAQWVQIGAALFVLGTKRATRSSAAPLHRSAEAQGP